MRTLSSGAGMAVPWLLAAAAFADVNPLLQFRQLTVEGGVTAAATCIGVNGGGGPSGGSISLSTIPAGGSVVEAYLYYVVEDPTAPVPAGSPTLNGLVLAPVKLAELGRNPWCNTQLNNTASFRADVTAMVSGNGVYTLAGFPANGGTAGTFTEGATLVVVYCRIGDATTDVVIYDGLDVVTADPLTNHTQTLTGFTVSSSTVAATWVAVVGNGQDTTVYGNNDDDPLIFNNNNMEFFLGSSAAVLSGGACAQSTQAPPSNGYWDVGLYDVSLLMSAGATSADVALSQSEDCYSIAAYALAVASDGTPGSCAPPVCPAPPGPVTRLKGVKTLPADVTWSWDPEPASAGGYHLYTVAPKAQIPATLSAGTQACVTLPGQTSCVHGAAITSAPAEVYDQVVGVCGDGFTEGAL